MGNNISCNVDGIGTISLKMYDGVVRTLKDVSYVPSLNRNLISLGILDESGFSFKVEDGRIKVLKRALIVMKGIRKNGLYVLEGKINVGNVN